jgi:hypothetical protein
MISEVISAGTLGIQRGVGCGRQETMVCAGGVGCGGPPDLTFFTQDTGWRGICGRLGCCEGPLSSALPLSPVTLCPSMLTCFTVTPHLSLRFLYHDE